MNHELIAQARERAVLLMNMARNYPDGGHTWDHLDALAVRIAAVQLKELAAALEAQQAAEGWKQIGWTCGEGDCGRIHDEPSTDDDYTQPVYVRAAPPATQGGADA